VSKVDINGKIPNNVDLAGDRRLQRALESWQPKYIKWWEELGPVAYKTSPIYLRTAVAVGHSRGGPTSTMCRCQITGGASSWPMPNQTARSGSARTWAKTFGKKCQADLRRLIVVQGDTEPASVEQQRRLCLTAPSLYDMRNLFQVNVEEGRHLWAMVYLLHRYFGRDGRDDADEMLERHSGDPDNPRILGAFNEETPDWLSFFMFTYFTDRDGKYQLASLRESAFDPLSRTCEFMLKEEAHHMFVGASGIARIIQRTLELMGEFDTDEVQPHGGVSLELIQKYINFHYSVSLDLFGSETSTNAANFYAGGIKGRFQETKRSDDHRLIDIGRKVPEATSSGITEREVTQLAALNETLRDDYTLDCQKGLVRWNRAIAEAGVDFEFVLPYVGFHRQVGTFRDHNVTPDGRLVDDNEWNASVARWLPTDADRAHVQSLMVAVTEPGKIAGWIAAPTSGIHQKPFEFAYVKL